MPQDSVYIMNNRSDSLADSVYSSGKLKETPALQDSAKKISYDTIIHNTSKQVHTVQEHSYDQSMALILYLSFIISIIIFPVIIRKISSEIRRRKLKRDYESKEVVFDSLLQHYSPYYKSLSLNNREIFLKRVLDFMESKEFKYVGIEPEDIMPLLISAAAVQLTFGLRHYKMDHFQNIYVLSNIYRYGLYNVPFEGHVSEDGIYLSWSNFMRDNNDYTDGENVGLHELAHALAYVNFTVDDGRDEWFHDKFIDFSKVGRPVFERMQAGEKNLLNNYAATNYNEFWAVCIESFFERPQRFKQELPELYLALCNLLNQDPMTQTKIISSIETN